MSSTRPDSASSCRSRMVRPPITSAALVRAVQPRGAAAGQDRRRAGASGEWRRRHVGSGRRRAANPRGGVGRPVRYQKMREPRIGRLVIAALHQAIAEALPLRLEFYENWLKPLGLLKEGKHIGPAPLSAALSFLRREDVGLYEVDHRPRRRARRRLARRLPALVGPPLGAAAAGMVALADRRCGRCAASAAPPIRTRACAAASGRAPGARRDHPVGLLPGARAGRPPVVRLLRRGDASPDGRLRPGGDRAAGEVPGHGRRGVCADRDLAAQVTPWGDGRMSRVRQVAAALVLLAAVRPASAQAPAPRRRPPPSRRSRRRRARHGC